VTRPPARIHSADPGRLCFLIADPSSTYPAGFSGQLASLRDQATAWVSGEPTVLPLTRSGAPVIRWEGYPCVVTTRTAYRYDIRDRPQRSDTARGPTGRLVGYLARVLTRAPRTDRRIGGPGCWSQARYMPGRRYSLGAASSTGDARRRSGTSAATARSKAATTAGSNCVPAQRRISAIACSCVIAGR